jgi:hypothetical protein
MSRLEKRKESLATRNLWNAGTRIRSAELFLSKEDWADAIREGNEALDFLAQALLFFSGIERNRFQQPGPLLLSSKEKIPFPATTDWTRLHQLLGEKTSAQDTSIGGADFMTFGDPFSSGDTLPPTKEDAFNLIADVRYLADICHKILYSNKART